MKQRLGLVAVVLFILAILTIVAIVALQTNGRVGFG